MDKEQAAIKRLQAASDMSLSAYDQKLVICISGGKDSSVITDLAIRAGIPAEFLHNHTTADAPEPVKQNHRLDALAMEAKIAKISYGQLMARRGKA